jgi:type II secretory pathway component PulF
LLFEVARLALRQQEFSSRVRELMAYPLATCYFALALFAVILRYVIPALEAYLPAGAGEPAAKSEAD